MKYGSVLLLSVGMVAATAFFPPAQTPTSGFFQAALAASPVAADSPAQPDNKPAPTTNPAAAPTIVVAPDGFVGARPPAQPPTSVLPPNGTKFEALPGTLYHVGPGTSPATTFAHDPNLVPGVVTVPGGVPGAVLNGRPPAEPFNGPSGFVIVPGAVFMGGPANLSTAPVMVPGDAAGFTNAPVPGPADKSGAVQVQSAAVGPNLDYWWNGSKQNQNQSICDVNLLPSITFYVSYYCNGNCGPTPGGNRFRWSIWLYRNGGSPIWSGSHVLQTNSDWINQPITLSAPVLPGIYYAVLQLEVRNTFGIWHTVVNQSTQFVTFTVPTTPIGPAPVPDIRLEVVADQNNDSIYKLRGWQKNPISVSMAGQWNIFNSDALGNTFGVPVFTGWATPGQTYTLNYTLSYGNWYLLQYGNYSDPQWNCYTWNDTLRLIYINKH